MKYAQRDGTNKIVGLYSQPHPHLNATEEVPDSTTLPEDDYDRVLRELQEVLATFSADQKAACRPVVDAITFYITQNKPSQAKQLVQEVGAVPVMTQATKNALVSKISEISDR